MSDGNCMSCGGSDGGPVDSGRASTEQRHYLGLGVFQSPLTRCYVFEITGNGDKKERFEVAPNSVLSHEQLDEFIRDKTVVVVAGFVDDDCITSCMAGGHCLDVLLYRPLMSPTDTVDLKAAWAEGVKDAAADPSTELSDELVQKNLAHLESLTAQATQIGFPDAGRSPSVPLHHNYCVDAASVAYRDYEVSREWARLGQRYPYNGYACGRLDYDR